MGWFDRPKKVKNSSRTKATESDVRHAYRLLLKRDPDPDGLAHFLQRVREGLTLDALIWEFVRSDEYLARLENERFEDEKAVDLGGYNLLVPTRDPEFGSDIYTFRIYEEPVRQAVRAHLHEGDVFIDVGANFGVMTFSPCRSSDHPVGSSPSSRTQPTSSSSIAAWFSMTQRTLRSCRLPLPIAERCFRSLADPTRTWSTRAASGPEETTCSPLRWTTCSARCRASISSRWTSRGMSQQPSRECYTS